ncbi:hypothetical protein [Pseudobacteriovorax antillogorgiicola]|uniref:Uncharacterized protein n=1 Tax=Pseudobacteriovorax antillogorgiicola TaxID=1513793 RepID=A0A1Y6BYC5_9BACT|nr:hypothetical protein [Pseudobacteriovorax antillogorgiicola]TCS50303.1 hypothetical protein EDD56_113121 [Pseudobacteriovorax antillogorgiicola]SMF34007.1 hypothetical protein SAMN06296036_110120 [Pseudobacteriovorax antillogorgiicola]
MKKLLLITCMLPWLMAFGAKHSSLETSVENQGQDLTIKFKIKANDGLELTHQAPWSVTITEAKDLSLETKNGKFVTKEYDKDLPGFTLKTKAQSQSGSFNYKMRAFVCKKDKTKCFPQTHKGKIDWSVAKK